MKDMGIEKLIFDKFNTLVKYGETSFQSQEIKESFIKAKEVFG